MEKKYLNGIICKLWSSAPIDKGCGAITEIFMGVASRRLADYAMELYSNGSLEAVISLINRCHTAENDDRLHQTNEEI